MEDTLNQTLLVTAPHPDDDIIGAFGLMRAFPGKVIVWFMTDGGGGERRIEAMQALNDVGVESVVWHNLPFYRTKDRTLTLEDVGVARGVLAMASPTHLAACYDCDPKETHVKCLTVLQQAALSTQVHVKLYHVYLYQSAWARTTFYPQQPVFVAKPVAEPELKEKALRRHASQLQLKVHDGFGTDLVSRGNLSTEYVWMVNVPDLSRTPRCFPSMERRVRRVANLGKAAADEMVWGGNVILPTGNTPLEMYRCLRELAMGRPREASKTHVYQLDEYLGDDEYKNYLTREVWPGATLHFFDRHDEAGCAQYDETVRSACIDLCVLGIGMNGHIGFNEPGSPFDSGARVVDLAESTVGANATAHRRAATLGLDTIMASKKILLLAKANKAAIVERLTKGPPSEEVPASVLWYHPNVEILFEP